MRALLVLVLVVHGLIHFMGFAKAFGLLQLPQLTEPISKGMGVVWLSAGLLTLSSVFVPARVFWIVGGLAALVSQAAIFSAWHDAKFGTLANVIVLLAAAYALASAGPWSFAATYARDAASVLSPLTAAKAPALELVTEADLQRLPAPVQRYLRVTGTLGQPRVDNFRVHWRGRIRDAANTPWMAFGAEQVNTTSNTPARMFFMQAVMKGLPVDVYHRFVGDSATFRVRLLSAFQLLSAAGPDMNRSETVTILNDLCLLAPSALLDPSMQWEASDESSAHVRFTRGTQTVHAELRFNAAGELVDFISDDRSRASADGKSFTLLRWSTPVTEYRAVGGGRRLIGHGKAQWHAPEGTFTYVELELASIELNVNE